LRHAEAFGHHARGQAPLPARNADVAPELGEAPANIGRQSIEDGRFHFSGSYTRPKRSQGLIYRPLTETVQAETGFRPPEVARPALFFAADRSHITCSPGDMAQDMGRLPLLPEDFT